MDDLGNIDHDLAARSQALTDALEQQAATAECLRVISRSPADAQPVFDTIASATFRLCAARLVNVLTYDGALLHIAALAVVDGQGIDALRSVFPRPASRDSAAGRAVLTCSTSIIDDAMADADHVTCQAAGTAGFRSIIGVPLLRDGEPIGAIAVGRAEPGPFPPSHIALLQSFADQAVMAIENMRLFAEREVRDRELAEALEHQTATSKILQTLSRMPSDVQPVFEAIVRAGVRLFRGAAVAISRHEGGLVRSVAIAEDDPVRAARWRNVFPIPLSREYIHGAAMLDCRVVDVADVQVLGGQLEAGKRNLAPSGYRAMTVVPLVRDGVAIGAIAVVRMTPGLLSPKQIALLETFADQAVIAIENVRLFNEREARNRELSDALEQQTATSEILRVISRSPTDVQPVFDAIAAAARRLCKSRSANVFTFDGRLIHAAALTITDPDELAAVHKAFPRPPGRELAAPRAILTRSVVEIRDVREDPDFLEQQVAAAANFRSVLAVPLMRNGDPLGAIAIGRPEPGPFPPQQVALLQTFADQAVIAIENARLFNETKEALARQTATSDVLRVISGSVTDTQPVFEKVLDSCQRLFGTDEMGICLARDGMIDFPAYRGRFAQMIKAQYPRPLAGSVRESVIRSGQAVHIADASATADMPGYVAELVGSVGNSSLVSAPMVWQGQGIGTIDVARSPPRPFSDKEIALLRTFADQAVIAIQNARLFNETKEALEQQTANAEVIGMMSRSTFNLEPVLETLIENACRLCRAPKGIVVLGDGVDEYRLAVHRGTTADETNAMLWLYRHLADDGSNRPARFLLDDVNRQRGMLTGRTALSREVVHVRDIGVVHDDAIAARARQIGLRSMLGVPLVADGQPLGVVVLWREQVLPFAEGEIRLVRGFADQAVIAIQNARLFKELQTRTAQLTESVEQLRALSEVGQAVGSTLDLATVLGTIVSRATELTGMDGGAIYEYDAMDESFTLHTAHLLPAPLVEALAASPMSKGDGAIGRLADTREPVAVADILDAGGYQSRVRELLVALGYRSLLAVPLLYEDRLLGGLVVNRRRAGEFDTRVIELLQTFATQSALAIQNARLFREVEDKSRQLEVASRHKSTFLAHMSHELRTPLNAIIGFTRIVMRRTREQVDAKQVQNLENILASAQHLLSLINAVLDLAKIEAGRVDVTASEVALAPLLDNCLRSVAPLLRGQVALGLDAAGDLPTMRVDEEKLRQILINLLSNAAKFTPHGRIDVRACFDGNHIEIAVADTGIGIPAAKLEAVFEEFVQVDASSTRVHGGTGLGLAIARRLARLMGGDLRVQTVLGAGSTFTLSLPMRFESTSA